VACVHRQEPDSGQGPHHRVGVVGGDAAGAEALQVEGLEIDEMAAILDASIAETLETYEWPA